MKSSCMRSTRGSLSRRPFGRFERVRRLQLWPRSWAFPRPVWVAGPGNARGELASVQDDCKVQGLCRVEGSLDYVPKKTDPIELSVSITSLGDAQPSKSKVRICLPTSCCNVSSKKRFFCLPAELTGSIIETKCTEERE